MNYEVLASVAAKMIFHRCLNAENRYANTASSESHGVNLLDRRCTPIPDYVIYEW
jgi:hypothetical protein